MGLLATFRLTGVLREPLTPETVTISETITRETVTWETERPSYHTDIHSIIESTYTDGKISITYSLWIDDYATKTWRFGGADYLDIVVNVTASATDGFVEDVLITFHENYTGSEAYLFEIQAWSRGYYATIENLSIADYTHHTRDYVKAFINLAGVNKPTTVHFSAPVSWILRSAWNHSHQLKVTSELTYYNGTAYKRVILPITLDLRWYDDDSFEKAVAIEPGVYSGFSLGGDDREDFYKIHLSSNETMHIEVHNELELGIPGHYEAYYYVYVYNPDLKLVRYSDSRDMPKLLKLTADSTGWWYIHVKHGAGDGFYKLTIKIGD